MAGDVICMFTLAAAVVVVINAVLLSTLIRMANTLESIAWNLDAISTKLNRLLERHSGDASAGRADSGDK
jgi:hypothetical protein